MLGFEGRGGGREEEVVEEKAFVKKHKETKTDNNKNKRIACDR